VYAQQSSSPLPSSASKEQQDIAKIKITSPTRGQQVPVGKDITISGTSIDNTSGSTNDCKVSVRVNKVSPYQPATPATRTADRGGTGAAATKDDYSKWNFVLTSKYTTIKPGQNRITAKYECGNNPALTSYSSLNVIGVSATTTAATTTATTGDGAVKTPISSTSLQTTRSTPAASNVANKPSSIGPNRSSSISIYLIGANAECPKGYHVNDRTTLGVFCDKNTPTPQTTSITTASINNNNSVSASNGAGGTVAPVNNLGNKSLSSPSTIAPRVNAINQQQPQLLTISNGTNGQNNTFASVSLVAAPGKLLYLGYHSDSSDNSGSTGKTNTKPNSGHDTNRDSSSKHTSSTGKSTSSTKSDSSSSNSHDSNRDSSSKHTDNSKTESSKHHSNSVAHHSSAGKNKSTAKSSSSSDLGSAIRNKVHSIIRNSLHGF
jgi:hypothetical protein